LVFTIALNRHKTNNIQSKSKRHDIIPSSAVGERRSDAAAAADEMTKKGMVFKYYELLFDFSPPKRKSKILLKFY